MSKSNTSNALSALDLISRQALINMLTRTPGVGNRILDVVRIAPTVLDDNDLCELEARFGKFVRFVVEDMITGEEKRWI